MNVMSLSEMVRQIEERDAVKKDYIVSTGNLEAIAPIPEPDDGVDGDGRLPVQRVPTIAVRDIGKRLAVSDVAHEQLGGWSPMGTRYERILAEQAPDLWATNLNHWFRENADGNNRMLRTLPHNGHGILRAFLSDKFGRYEDAHLLRPVLERATDKGWDVHQCALTDRRMHIRVMFPRMQGEIRRGDPVQAGVAFTNSEVGFGAWRVEFFINRLVCTNGMVSKQFVAGFSRRHITGRQESGWLSASTLAMEDRLLQAKVGDTLEAMEDLKKFDGLLSVMRDSADAMPADPIGATIEMARRASLTRDETTDMQRQYIDGGDRSLWGLVNALTATARDVPSFERRAELESAAGNIIEHPRAWRGIIEAQAPKGRVA